MKKITKIEGSESNIGCKYETEDKRWRLVPRKDSTRYAGVGQKRSHYVSWVALEIHGDREIKALTLKALVKKLEGIAA